MGFGLLAFFIHFHVRRVLCRYLYGLGPDTDLTVLSQCLLLQLLIISLVVHTLQRDILRRDDDIALGNMRGRGEVGGSYRRFSRGYLDIVGSQ